jgi:hypothetical protein
MYQFLRRYPRPQRPRIQPLRMQIHLLSINLLSRPTHNHNPAKSSKPSSRQWRPGRTSCPDHQRRPSRLKARACPMPRSKQVVAQRFLTPPCTGMCFRRQSRPQRADVLMAPTMPSSRQSQYVLGTVTPFTDIC